MRKIVIQTNPQQFDSVIEHAKRIGYRPGSLLLGKWMVVLKEDGTIRSYSSHLSFEGQNEYETLTGKQFLTFPEFTF